MSDSQSQKSVQPMSNCQLNASVSQMPASACKPGHGNPLALDAICLNNQNLDISKQDPCCKTKIQQTNMVALKESVHNNLNSISKTCATSSK